jgi:hypothetical protein
MAKPPLFNEREREREVVYLYRPQYLMATTIHKISGNYFGLPQKLATFIYLKVQNLHAFDDYYRIEVLGAGCLKGNNGIQSSGLGVAQPPQRPKGWPAP